MSPKSHYKYITVIIVLLIINLYLAFSQRSQLEDLKQNTNNQYNRLTQDINYNYSAINDLSNELRLSVEESASLFTDYDITLTPSGSKIVANITAIPKALTANSKVIVSVAAGQETYEAELNKKGHATISFPITQEITPTLKIISPDKVQSESRDTLFTFELLNIPMETHWLDETNEDGTMPLSAVILNREDQPTLSADIIDKAYFIRENVDPEIDIYEILEKKHEILREISSDGGNAKRALLKTLQETGTKVSTTMTKQSDTNEIVFKAQTPIDPIETENASFYFVFIVETKDGRTYMSSFMDAATYDITSNGSGASSGYGTLFPIFTN